MIAGTLFLEEWKRKNAELAYKWDVDNFEDQVRRMLCYFVVWESQLLLQRNPNNRQLYTVDTATVEKPRKKALG